MRKLYVLRGASLAVLIFLLLAAATSAVARGNSFNGSAMTGQLTIRKVALGGDSVFAFGANGVGVPPVPASFALATVNGVASVTYANVPAGETLVAESNNLPQGWDFSSLACTGDLDSGNVIRANIVWIDLDDGEDQVCTFTNTKRGSITIVKNTVGGDSTFSYMAAGGAPIGNFDLTTVGGSASRIFLDVYAGNYSFTEGPDPMDWQFASLDCTGNGPNGSVVGRTANVHLLPGGSVTCTSTSTRGGMLQVTKTVSNGPIVGTEHFLFQIRQNASPENVGTVLESQTANSANGGLLSFSTILIPGSSYQICEANMLPGWSTSLSGFVPGGKMPNPDNSVICGDIAVQPGGTAQMTVNNSPPPDGAPKGIGYWKNWSSCTNGNQAPVLDYVLWSFAGGPIAVEMPLPAPWDDPSTYPSPPYAGTMLGSFHIANCELAVMVLNKRAIGTNRNMASNPAVSLAAQLLAAKLNRQASAGSPCVSPAIALADEYLKFVGYDGTAPDVPAHVRNAMRSLAEILEGYNNGELGCPAPPLPPNPQP